MKIKGIMDQNFQDYKDISFYIAFPSCTFKCETDWNSKEHFCSNCELIHSPDIEISVEKLVERYKKTSLVSALICAGLEPLDSFNDLIYLIKTFREDTMDTVVIYTGYYPNEVSDKIEILKNYKNIIIKFGRYIPGKPKRYDDLLGITLASDNQFAEKIS